MARSTVKKKNIEAKSFESYVGTDTYNVWINMLKSLVPHGRTHRLAIVVAGMVQYATDMICKKDPGLYEKLFESEDYDDYDVGNKELGPYVEKLFTDAKVKSVRTNSRGQAYSLVESALMEHERWDYMPWE